MERSHVYDLEESLLLVWSTKNDLRLQKNPHQNTSIPSLRSQKIVILKIVWKHKSLEAKGILSKMNKSWKYVTTRPKDALQSYHTVIKTIWLHDLLKGT